MSPDVKQWEDQALKLRPQERASLAQQLVASLDELDDAENERLWLEEADKRYREYKESGDRARAAEDVIRDARSAIR